MASDEFSDLREKERRQLLEEIRARAEEAELRRIEEEVQKSQSNPDSFSPDPPRQSASVRNALIEALEAGDLEQISKLYAELAALTPGSPDYSEIQNRIDAFRNEEAKNSTDGLTSADPKKPKPSPTRRHGRAKDTLGESLRKARESYEREKFAIALLHLDAVLAIDPENEEALDLRLEVESAKTLSDAIEEEEARQREREIAEDKSKTVHRARRSEPPPAQSTSADPEFEEPPLPPLTDPITPDSFTINGKEQKVSNVDFGVFKKWLVVILAVIATGYLVWLIYGSVRLRVFPPRSSIVIFPFVSAGTDSSDDYYIEGLTEQLIADIAKVKRLRVIAPVTAFSFQRHHINKARMAKDLSVRYFVHGSFIRSAEHISLQIALFDTLSSQPLFVRQYQQRLTKIAELRSDVLASFLESMKIGLDSEEQELVKNEGEVDVKAYNLYLIGKFHLRHREGGSYERAIKSFEAAVAIDPTSRSVTESLAWSYILQYESGIDTARSLIEKAFVNVRRARELGSRSAEMYRAWGVVELYKSQEENGVLRLEQSVGASPADAESQKRLALGYLRVGRIQDALEPAEKARDLDPRNPEALTLFGLTQKFNENYERALEAFRSCALLVPDSLAYLAQYTPDLLVNLHRYEQAIDLLRVHITHSPNNAGDYYRLGRVLQRAGQVRIQWESSLQKSREILVNSLTANPSSALLLSELAIVETAMGDFKKGEQISSDATQLGSNDVDVLYNTARMYAIQRGKKTEMLDFLSKAVRKRFLIEKVLDMDFYSFRSDPEFIKTIAH